MNDSDCFYMTCFRPGMTVRWSGRSETVSHVLLRRGSLLVHLVGHESPVPSERLSVDPMLFTRKRAPGVY